MRIDLPLCNLKTCRYCSDGNCTKKHGYDGCEYAMASCAMERILERLEQLPTKKTTKMMESKEMPEWFYEVVTGEYINKKDAIEIVKEEGAV